MKTWGTGKSRSEKKIDSFKELPAGWYYGRGAAPADAVIQLAADLYRDLITSGFSLTDAFPGADGEIQVTGYRSDRTVAVTVLPDLMMDFTYEVGQNVEEEFEAADYTAVRRALSKVAADLWPSSGLSTRSTMIHTRAVSSILLSRNLPMAGSQFSALSAPKQLAA